MKTIPFLGWTPKKLLTVFVIIAVVIAVVWRVGAIRKIVTGA